MALAYSTRRVGQRTPTRSSRPKEALDLQRPRPQGSPEELGFTPRVELDDAAKGFMPGEDHNARPLPDVEGTVNPPTASPQCPARDEVEIGDAFRREDNEDIRSLRSGVRTGQSTQGCCWICWSVSIRRASLCRRRGSFWKSCFHRTRLGHDAQRTSGAPSPNLGLRGLPVPCPFLGDHTHPWPRPSWTTLPPRRAASRRRSWCGAAHRTGTRLAGLRRPGCANLEPAACARRSCLCGDRRRCSLALGEPRPKPGSCWERVWARRLPRRRACRCGAVSARRRCGRHAGGRLGRARAVTTVVARLRSAERNQASA